MQLFLVRHGETTYNRRGRVQGQLDTPLTSHGVEQAERLAERMEERFEAVYSSTLQRTHRTARILASTPITPLPGLAGIDMGTATGMLKADLHAQLETAAERDELWHPPHGEHPERFQERVVSTMQGIANRHTGTVLVVTHGGVIRAYLHHLKGTGFVAAHRRPVPNGAVTIVDPVNGVAGETVSRENVY